MKAKRFVFTKLSLITGLVFAIGALIGSFLAYYFTNQAMFEQSRMHLEAVLNSRSTLVEDYFKTTQRQVSSLAGDDSIVDATLAFTKAMGKLEDELAGQVDVNRVKAELTEFYADEFAPRLEGASCAILALDCVKRMLRVI